MSYKRFITRLGLLSALFLVASIGFAQNTKTIHAGLTSVKLSSTFTSALGSLGVTPGTVEPTRIRGGVASFPVIGGAADLDTAVANIVHSGGLTLTAGQTQVRLQSFIIDTTGTAPALTGLVVVNNKLVGRLALFNVIPPPNGSLPVKPEGGYFLREKGVGLTLTSTAAAALNQVFSVSAFGAGLDIGTAEVFLVVDRSW